MERDAWADKSVSDDSLEAAGYRIEGQRPSGRAQRGGSQLASESPAHLEVRRGDAAPGADGAGAPPWDGWDEASMAPRAERPLRGLKRAALGSALATAGLIVSFYFGLGWFLPGVREAALVLAAALAGGVTACLVSVRWLYEWARRGSRQRAARSRLRRGVPRGERDDEDAGPEPLGLWRNPESVRAEAAGAQPGDAQDSEPEATWKTHSGRIVLKRFSSEAHDGSGASAEEESELLLALRNKRDELAQRLRERALLFDILRITASECELQQVVNDLATRLLADLRLRECAIFLREIAPDGGIRFVVRAASGFKHPQAVLGRSLREGEGVSGEVAKIRHPILVPDVKAEPHYLSFWSQVARDGSFAAFPVIHRQQLIAVMALTRPPEDTLSEMEVRFLSAVADQMALAISHAELFERLRAESTLDDLTGLANRRLFQQRLQLELERVARFGQPLSVMLIDIDHFKQLNDRCGHGVGDEALKLVARIIGRCVRRIDTVARHGGEEFVVVLPNATVVQAARVGEKIRQALATSSVPGGEGQPAGYVSVSIGVAQLSRGQVADALIERADQAMYAAKTGGRDRVAYFPTYGGKHPEIFEPLRASAPTERPLKSEISALRPLSSEVSPRTEPPAAPQDLDESSSQSAQR